MRIIKLTKSFEESFFAARSRRNDSAVRVASRIVTDVRRRGDDAVIGWSKKLDGGPDASKEIWVSRAERRAALHDLPKEVLGAIRHAARNIRRVAEQQLPKEWTIQVEPGVRVGQRVIPIGTVGCYIPGGRHALVSTLLMTAIPAQVAGVPRIVVMCPKPSAAILAAAEMLGIADVGRIGGAQAIAALAYGTRTIPRVDKIVGPGNRWVDAAKKLVSNDCSVDLPAGPTELLVLAERGNPHFIAADMIAQAEHDPDAVAICVTTSARLSTELGDAIEEQLSELPPENPARKSLAMPGTILLAKNIASAIEFANRFAPEHLSLPDGERFLGGIRAAGSIFLGLWSAQPLGDYSSGTNHVLPTGGWARARGGLSAADFVKCVSVQHVSAVGFSRIGPVAKTLANAEGLAGHSKAIEIRERGPRISNRGTEQFGRGIGKRRKAAEQ